MSRNSISEFDKERQGIKVKVEAYFTWKDNRKFSVEGDILTIFNEVRNGLRANIGQDRRDGMCKGPGVTDSARALENLKRSGWLDHMEPPGALRSAGVSRKLLEGFESCYIKGIMDY